MTVQDFRDLHLSILDTLFAMFVETSTRIRNSLARIHFNHFLYSPNNNYNAQQISLNYNTYVHRIIQSHHLTPTLWGIALKVVQSMGAGHNNEPGAAQPLQLFPEMLIFIRNR